MNKKIIVVAISAIIFNGGILAADNYSFDSATTTTNTTNNLRSTQANANSDAFSNSGASSGSQSFANGGAGGSASARGGSSNQGQGQDQVQQANNAGNAQNITFNSTAPEKTTNNNNNNNNSNSTSNNSNTNNSTSKIDSNSTERSDGKLNQNIDYGGGYKLKNVPAMAAPGLTTTLTETCMGSTSGAFAIAGLGLSGGTTWTDSNCVRRLDAREIRAMGAAEVAKELMCTGRNNYKAFQRASIKLGKPELACVANEDFDKPGIFEAAPEEEEKVASTSTFSGMFGFGDTPDAKIVPEVKAAPVAKVEVVEPAPVAKVEVVEPAPIATVVPEMKAAPVAKVEKPAKTYIHGFGEIDDGRTDIKYYGYMSGANHPANTSDIFTIGN